MIRPRLAEENMAASRSLIGRLVRSSLSQKSGQQTSTAIRHQLTCRRSISSADARNPLNRPSPPPLPREAQREFEDLVRKAQAPLTQTSSNRALAEADLAMHPDARAPVSPEFVGEVNPSTGETGGPKVEPVKQWIEGDGDWSFKGRVSDF